jgi:hypothetical protein
VPGAEKSGSLFARAARAWMPLLEIDFCGIYRLCFDVSENSYYLIWDLMNFNAWKD